MQLELMLQHSQRKFNMNILCFAVTEMLLWKDKICRRAFHDQNKYFGLDHCTMKRLKNMVKFGDDCRRFKWNLLRCFLSLK